MAKYRSMVGALSFAAETTEGTAETSLTTTIRAQDITLNFDLRTFRRPVVSSTFGTFSQIPGAKSASLTFSVAAVGAASLANLGSNGAECHLLYGAAQLDPVLSANTSAVYTLETTDAADMKSLTIRFYIDGLYFVMRGARCSEMRLVVAQPGDPIMHQFTFIGVTDHEQAAASVPSPTYVAVNPAPCLASALAIGGTTVVVKSVSIVHSNGTKLREDINNADGYISAMNTFPETSFQMMVEPEATGTIDFMSLAEDGTESAFTMSSGTGTTANELTITAPKLQIVSVQPQNDGGQLMYNLSGVLNRNSGDDSLVLSWTAG